MNRQSFNSLNSKQPQTTSRIAFAWLLNLRWGALFTQILLILVVSLFFNVETPLLILTVIVSFGAISNIYFYVLAKQKSTIPESITVSVMFLDIILLSLLLIQTGGPMNPFTFLYLIHIALGAILLPAVWAWALAILTIICYAGLFFLPDLACLFDLSMPANQSTCHTTDLYGVGVLAAGSSDELTLHLHGMWVAFTITAVYIVFFIGMIQKALAKHQEMLADLKDKKIMNEKLAALATLSAGAAHEFSTPLSTIAVASSEMLHHIKSSNGDPELIADAILIRNQVDHCKEILYQLAADAGEPLGESISSFTLNFLFEELLTLFPRETAERLQLLDETQALTLNMPYRTLKRAIKGLVKNAFDASPGSSPIVIQCVTNQSFLYIEILDQGMGMDQETLAKACEPFFTTKEPGQGMGLGLFLAKTVAERFGGSLRIDSTQQQGTKVVFTLALNQIH